MTYFPERLSFLSPFFPWQLDVNTNFLTGLSYSYIRIGSIYCREVVIKTSTRSNIHLLGIFDIRHVNIVSYTNIPRSKNHSYVHIFFNPSFYYIVSNRYTFIFYRLLYLIKVPRITHLTRRRRVHHYTLTASVRSPRSIDECVFPVTLRSLLRENRYAMSQFEMVT